MEIERTIALQQVEFINEILNEGKKRGGNIKYVGRASKDAQADTDNNLRKYDASGVRVAYFEFSIDGMPWFVRHRLNIKKSI